MIDEIGDVLSGTIEFTHMLLAASELESKLSTLGFQIDGSITTEEKLRLVSISENKPEDYYVLKSAWIRKDNTFDNFVKLRKQIDSSTTWRVDLI